MIPFQVRWRKGEDIDKAIDFANIVGTLTVMKKGVQSSLPLLVDVMKYENDNV